MILIVVIFVSLIYNVYSSRVDSIVTLKTNYVEVKIDVDLGAITSLSANFFGGQNFTKNVLASPVLLEAISAKDGTSMAWSKRVVTKVEADQSKLNFVVESFQADSPSPATREAWSISVNANSRKIEAQVDGQLLREVAELQALAYGLRSPNPSLYALTTQGMLQMMGQAHACLGLQAELERYYALGAGSALEVQALPLSVGYVLTSSTSSEASGLQAVVLGQYPRASRALGSAWSSLCWQEGQALEVGEASWSLSLSLLPNDHNFPTHSLQDIASTGFEGWSAQDVETYLMGPYVSAAGCLQSYYTNQQGIIAPTVSHPDVGYDPDTNFFDPDNFMTLSALLYSNDAYLHNEVKEVLRRTAATICGLGAEADPFYCEQPRQRFLTSSLRAKAEKKERVKSRYGQLMHHFVSLRPTYESIAGSEQLGPNIFWTLAALRYIAITQDMGFEEEMLPYIQLSVQFVLTFIDKLEGGKGTGKGEKGGDMFIVNAPGPLWIDVLVREHYASDSNTMMVHFLREVGDYFFSLGESDQAAQLEAIAAGIVRATNALLWDGVDHYITQYNPIDKTSRDFVDYDSNLMAVAFGFLSPPDALKVLQRIDSNPVSHVRATYCSEIAYSGNASDCYIVGGDYCGDSIVTLARIGYVDAWARKRLGQGAFIRKQILEPLQVDELTCVWMYERYDQYGVATRTPFYFEYPALVTMVLREMVYGIMLKRNALHVDPLDSHASYKFSLGNVRVSYSREGVELRAGSAEASVRSGRAAVGMKVRITGLYSNAVYTVHREGEKSGEIGKVESSAEGVVEFETEKEALSIGLSVRLVSK